MFNIFKSKDKAKEQKKQEKSKQPEAYESKEQSEVDTIEQAKRQAKYDHDLTIAIMDYKDQQLLKNIKQQWPQVEFLSSDQLGDLINSTK